MGEVLESRVDEARVGRQLATVRFKWVHDESPDIDRIGKYVQEWEEGAIDVSRHRKLKDGELRYFVSTNNSKFNPKDWSHLDGKEKRDIIRKYGSLKNANRAYAMEDFKRAEAFNDGEWSMTGCIVTVTVGKTETKDSLWGIESDCGDSYRRDVELDCLSEAIAEMKTKLKEQKPEKKRRRA